MKWNLLKINKNKNFIVTITINVLTKYLKQKMLIMLLFEHI